MKSLASLACALLMVLATNSVCAKPYSFWTTLATSKYMRGEVPAKSVPVSLDASGNEWEAFQVIVRADKPITSASVTVDDLKSKNGTISRDNIELRLAHYIELKEAVGGGFPKGFYPDALLPMPSRFTIEQGKTQMIWVNIHIPSTASAGDHKGKLTLAIDGSKETINIHLRVRPFALSVANHFGSAFALWPDQVATYYGLKLSSQEMRSLLDRYYWFMINYRLAPDDLPVPVTSPEADKYVNDPRVASFRLPYGNPEQFKKEVAHVREKGWLPKAYIYTLDEPGAADYPNCASYGRQIDSLAKDVKWLLTTAPNNALYGTVDIWCPILHCYNPEVCAERQSLGETVWWYTCVWPQHPYPTYLINDTATAPRVLSWFQYLNKVEGVLYWSTSIWLKFDGKYIKRDVWNDPLAFPIANGDGYLLYPGKTYGDDPIPSLRLEMLRQGNEDFETLYLLESKYAELAKSLGISKADYDPHSRAADYVGRIGNGLTTWNRDASLMESVRRQILDDIETAGSSPKVIVSTASPEGAIGDGVEIPVTIWAEEGTSIAAAVESDGSTKSVGVRMKPGSNGRSMQGKFSLTMGRDTTRLVVRASKGRSTRTLVRTFHYYTYKPMATLKDPSVVCGWRSEADANRWLHNDTDVVPAETKSLGDCARVTFHTGVDYPNIRLVSPNGFTDTDWSRKRYLSIAFYNPNDFDVSLVGKLFDLNGKACDGLRFVLGPGESRMESWNLHDLPSAIDLGKFHAIEIWMHGPSKPVSIYVGTVATTAEKPE